MAFIDGHCQRVLSMRGYAQAQAIRDGTPPVPVGPMVETLAAPERGHSRRHLGNEWGTLHASPPPQALQRPQALQALQAHNQAGLQTQDQGQEAALAASRAAAANGSNLGLQTVAPGRRLARGPLSLKNLPQGGLAAVLERAVPDHWGLQHPMHFN